jgi:hypothetical protein
VEKQGEAMSDEKEGETTINKEYYANLPHINNNNIE